MKNECAMRLEYSEADINFQTVPNIIEVFGPNQYNAISISIVTDGKFKFPEETTS